VIASCLGDFVANLCFGYKSKKSHAQLGIYPETAALAKGY
jgi:hypothetical protein